MKVFFHIISLLLFLSSCFEPKDKKTDKHVEKSSEEDKPQALLRHEAYFNEHVKTVLASNCSHCHENRTASYQSTFTLITLGEVEQSLLYSIVTGKEQHPEVFHPHSPEVETLRYWLSGNLNKPMNPVQFSIEANKLDVDYYQHYLAEPLSEACSECHASPINNAEEAKQLSQQLLQKVRGIWLEDNINHHRLINWLQGEKLGVRSTQEAQPTLPLTSIPFSKEFYDETLQPWLTEDCGKCHGGNLPFFYAIEQSIYQNADESPLYKAAYKKWMQTDPTQPDQLSALRGWIEGSPKSGPQTSLNQQFFYEQLRPKLKKHCGNANCHGNENIIRSLYTALNFIQEGNPEASDFYLAATGELEITNADGSTKTHKRPLHPEAKDLKMIYNWIQNTNKP